jgi:hypothetical protein
MKNVYPDGHELFVRKDDTRAITVGEKTLHTAQKSTDIPTGQPNGHPLKYVRLPKFYFSDFRIIAQKTKIAITYTGKCT